MFDREVRWFIRCDTCPGPYVVRTQHPQTGVNEDAAAAKATFDGWEVGDGLHRCPECVREGRTERAL